MYNILPLILILISLSVIIYIISKKFPALANIDISTMQKEKEAKTKEILMGNRLKRSFVKYSSRFFGFLKIFSKITVRYYNYLYKKIEKKKQDISGSSKVKVDVKEQIRRLFVEAIELKNRFELKSSEQKVIEIISLDSKNIEAFKLLGDIYLQLKDFTNAKETLKYVLKIVETEEEDASEIYYNLALVDKAQENFEQAHYYLLSALKIQPNNPRYLDTMIEISIMNKDVLGARDFLEKLAIANPDNKKISVYKEKIKELK
jgi:tetratricopeptide (TPR) repeat protein